MDSQHSEQHSEQPSEQPSGLFSRLARFQEAARRGDWISAGTIAAELKIVTLSANPDELGEYLHRLHHALAVARASRAASAGTLRRLSAVAKFGRASANSTPKRQNLVDLTSY